MPAVTLFGGHRQIGGNKILLSSRDGAVFLDFGKDFSTEGLYFEEPWNPPFHVPSLEAIGALPPIEGLYRTSRGTARVDGVLISHAHLDHVGYVPLLAGSVPVYAGDDTKNLVDIRNEAARGDWRSDDDHLQWRTFRTGQEVVIEGAQVRIHPVHVDHSVPASYAFIIEADGKRIAYTGDLRLHGRHAAMTGDFLAALGASRVDALLCEGTHVFPPEGEPDEALRLEMERVYRDRMGEDAPRAVRLPCATEEDVEARITEILRESEALALVEVSPLDMDRMWSVWRAAAAAGRRLVLPAKQAYMMREAARRTRIRDIVPVEETDLFLSQRRKDRRERAADEDEDAEEFTKGRQSWERDLAEWWSESAGEVFWGPAGRTALCEGGSRHVLCAPQVVYILPELCYRARPCPISFVLSKSEPFTEEMLFSFDKLLHWLRLFGCREYFQVHVSGHAPAEDIRRIIETADPGLLLPIHTKHPDLFRPWHDRVAIPEAQGVAVEV